MKIKMKKIILILNIIIFNLNFAMQESDSIAQEVKNKLGLEVIEIIKDKSFFSYIKNFFNSNWKLKKIKTLLNSGLPGMAGAMMGANLKICDNNGETALTFASFYGDKEIVQLLLENGANIDEKNNFGSTALMLAVLWGQKEMLELLIKLGANINEKDKYGKTPLEVARENGHEKIITILNNIITKKQAQINKYKDNLFQTIKTGDYKGVRDLIIKVTLRVYDENGNNPLIVAAKCNNIAIFMLILSIRPSLISEIDKDNNNVFQIWPTLAHYLNNSFNKNNNK